MYEYVLQISLCPSRINLPRIPGGTIAYQYHVLIVQWSLLNYNHCSLSHIPTFISFKSSLKESTSGHFEESGQFVLEVDYELTNPLQLIMKSMFHEHLTQALYIWSWDKRTNMELICYLTKTIVTITHMSHFILKLFLKVGDNDQRFTDEEKKTWLAL